MQVWALSRLCASLTFASRGGQRSGQSESSLALSARRPVPFALEITMRPGGQLTGDGLASLPDVPNAHLLAEGFASYELAGRRLRIGPGFRRHTWTQLRGAELRLPGVTLYMTDFPPLHRTLRFAAQ